MTEPSTFAGPAPMEGHGFYNRSSTVQSAGLSPAVPLLQRAAGAVPLADASEPIVIADYGSSEGHNSLVPIAAAIRVLRDRVGSQQAISVVHTDLPGNDFTLFQTLTDDPDSYLRGDPSAFASAVGRQFYQQILPSCSVTLGWSSWAVQWLSRPPGPIPDQVQVAYSRDSAARAAYTAQAADDWRAFLTSRGRELRAGGRLVVLTMALRHDGDFGYRGVLAAMYAALTLAHFRSRRPCSGPMMAKQPTTPTYTRLASASSPTCAARWKRWRCSHDQQANTRHWPAWRTRRLARCSHQRHTNEEWGDLWLPWVRVAVVMATRDKTPAEDASVLELATFNDGEMIDGIENARRHLHCLVGVLDKAMERITAVMAEAGRTRETLNDNLN